MNTFYYGKIIRCLILFLKLAILTTVVEGQSPASPAANLDQAKNGTDAAPVNPIGWINGNLGSTNAHYIEGQSIPYRCVMTGLTAGTKITLVMGYDIRNSSHNALDYLTHYNRLQPHVFTFHSTAETINPLAGSGLASAPFTTYLIPAPSSAGSLVTGQPTTSFNSLTSTERSMTLYNGRIDSIYYSVQGSLTASSSETQIVVKFTANASTVVLVWGGHIASRRDWGYVNGQPLSAGGISGSPFHMRLKSWSYGSLGSQDRSLTGTAVMGPVVALPVDILFFDGHAVAGRNDLNWATASEVNSDYFVIEKSDDGKSFTEAGIVKAHGNSTSPLSYQFTDNNPLNKTSYYRLIEIDYDGMRNDYGVIAITQKNHVVPQLLIYNLQGALIMTIENPSLNEARPNIPPGFYIFQYNGDKGVIVKKIFVDR